MSIITVFKTEFAIGAVTVDGYTANEIDPATGKFINYLSGAGLAESIGLNESTTRSKRLPKGLEDILGTGFTTVQGSYKMESGGKSKLNLWDTTSAALYYRYHDKQNNILAGAIVTALISTTLDIIIDDRFGRVYKQGEVEARVKARLAGKYTRRTLTDSVKEYLGKQNEVSENYRKFIYSNCSDKINKSLFGKTAAQLCELRKCDRDILRNTHSAVELVLIDRIEGHAVRLIDRGMEPLLAVTDAIDFYS